MTATTVNMMDTTLGRTGPGAAATHGRMIAVSSFLVAFIVTFGVILLVELPDKTLVASLVLSTRYRPRPVLLGVAAAFAIQCTIAVVAGGLLHLLPHRALEGVVAGLFAIGAILLLRESFAAEDDVELAEARENAPFFKIAVTSFGVLFAAEWGDASQIATAGLVAREGEPLAVGLGAWLALVAVAALAVVAGKLIIKKVPVHVVQRVAGALFAVFAVAAAVAAIRG
jgi:putative Ca2+/H+ antiporter (TMEM165/GDT1 family)